MALICYLRVHFCSMDRAGNAHGDQYAPGHTPNEIERLIDQGRWFADLTERLLRDAGMVPGMSVLDVGWASRHAAAETVSTDGVDHITVGAARLRSRRALLLRERSIPAPP